MYNACSLLHMQQRKTKQIFFETHTNAQDSARFLYLKLKRMSFLSFSCLAPWGSYYEVETLEPPFSQTSLKTMESNEVTVDELEEKFEVDPPDKDSSGWTWANSSYRDDKSSSKDESEKKKNDKKIEDKV